MATDNRYDSPGSWVEGWEFTIKEFHQLMGYPDNFSHWCGEAYISLVSAMDVYSKWPDNVEFAAGCIAAHKYLTRMRYVKGTIHLSGV